MKANINISNTYINFGNIQNNKGIEIITSDFDINLKNTIIKFIKNSISEYSESVDISKSIHSQCKEALGGKWDITVGERNKYSTTFDSEDVLGLNAGPYKIIVKYYGE